MLNAGGTSELCRVGPFVLELVVLISFVKRRFGFSTEPLLVWKGVPVGHQAQESGGTGEAFTLAL